jgi:hypothetical protein
MSEHKHTPGPWTAKPFGLVAAENFSKPYRLESVCETPLAWIDNQLAAYNCSHETAKWLSEWRERAAANARLIAAAPDLLEACEDALSRLSEFCGTDCECDNTHEANGTKCGLCSIRAAIAKAVGD